MASLKLSTNSSVLSIPSSSRKFINDIPPDIRSKLCTEIDYTIHRNEGYWQKLIGRLGFDETHSKKFRLSFEMHGSPTDNLLRDCSYRMLRIRHLYQILMEIGLTNLAQAYLKDFDTEGPLPPMPIPFSMTTGTRSTLPFESLNSSINFGSVKGASWAGIDTFHFSFDAIREGTSNFSPKMELGAGAFGKVYKVYLNNTLFACKVLKIDKENPLTTSLRETHRQHDDLKNELNYLAEYRHPNVIALYGWSLDGPDPCLIYDYMKNGSLQDRLQCLNSSKPMDWEVRIKVSCGAARGLQFLHTKNAKPLIHGDIKTANILLDNSFTAKLGDFGLAREMPHNAATGSYIRLGNEHTPGTLGYLANEYIHTKKLSVQVDTYAFGVVLLELYTGRRAFDRTKKTPSLRDYMDDVANESSKNANEKLFRLQDPRIDNLYNEAALKFVRLALACCHEKRKERPKMADTLAELNEIERMVAVADGREPEESVPASGAVNGRDQLGTNTLQRQPVESVDNSVIIADQIAAREKQKPGPSKLSAALESKLNQINLQDFSSSEDSADSGGYYVQRPPDPYAVLYPPGHVGNQPSYYPSSHPSSSVPPHPYYHGCVAGMNKGRMGEGQELHYSPGPSYCSAGKGIVENPYKLDLSKIPRPPCYCPSCSLVPQPNMSPLQSQGPWPSQVECAPETFFSVDYNVPASYNAQYYYASKQSTNGDISPSVFSSNRPQVASQNSKFPIRDSSEFREVSVDSSIHSLHQSQANAFSFQTPYGASELDPSESLSTQPSVKISSAKESMLEGLKQFKTYTQIFPDPRRTPTESSSEN